MDATHLHLLVNHLPILGSFFALPLLALALWRRREPWLLAGAVLLLVVAAGGAVVAEESGEGAEEAVEHLPGVDEAMIHDHEERAEVAVPLAVVTALAGLVAAAWSLRRGTVFLPAGGAVLALTLASAGAMAWVGQSGGVIRHTEIRAEAGGVAGGPEANRGGRRYGEGEDGEDDD